MSFSLFSKLFEFRGRALSFSSAFIHMGSCVSMGVDSRPRGNGCRGALSSDVACAGPGRQRSSRECADGAAERHGRLRRVMLRLLGDRDMSSSGDGAVLVRG